MKVLRKRLIALSMLAATALTAAPANALVINLIDGGGLTPQARTGFQIAAKYWESVLTSNATVNFNVSLAALGEGILGGTSSNLFTDVPISTYYALLGSANSGNALDAAALGGLRPLSATGSVSAIVPAYLNPTARTGIAGEGTRLTPDGRAISNTMAISTANVKALLGDGSSFADVVDADIQFSSTFDFDFDPSDGIATGAYDFIGVAVHEMGHALGFLSGADDFDYSVGNTGAVDSFWWGYALDMFRYSAPGQLDWSFGSDSYFSLDGGLTAYRGAYFSTGENNGDGWQASHWKAPTNAAGQNTCSPFEGIMNPYLCSRQVAEVTASDLALLDAIGWNTNRDTGAGSTYTFNSAQMYLASGVPEPATWAMMMLGFGFIGGALRNRRGRTTVTFAT